MTINAWNSNNPAEVDKGGTGVTSTTAYAVLCGGVTSTNPLQSIASVGTTGQVLISNGAGALPTFQNSALSYMVFSAGGILGASAGIRYQTFGASLLSATTPGIANMPIPFNAIISNVYVRVVTNSNTNSYTLTLFVNGSPTALVVTVPATTTGIFSDTTNSVSVSAGDLICYQESKFATTTIVFGSITALVTPT